MPIKYADRVKETTSTIGTGAYLLAGALKGFQTVAASLNDGDQAYFGIENNEQWEVITGTYDASANTIARAVVHASSNSGNAVDWQTGVKRIYLTIPAVVAATIDASNMTGAEIKTALESEADTNTVTDAEKSAIGNLPADTVTAIADEALARAQADANLQDNIDTESASRSAADSALQAAIDALDLVMLGRASPFRISSGEFTTSPSGTVKNTGQSATYRLDTGTGVSRRVVRGIDLLIANGSGGKLNFGDQFAIIFKGGYRTGTTGTGNFLACGVSTTGYSATPKTGNGMWLDLRDLDIYAAQNGAAADTTINTAIGNVSTYILQNNGDGTGSLTVDGTLAHTYSGLPTSGEVQAFVDAYNSDTSASCAGVFDDNAWVIVGPF